MLFSEIDQTIHCRVDFLLPGLAPIRFKAQSNRLHTQIQNLFCRSDQTGLDRLSNELFLIWLKLNDHVTPLFYSLIFPDLFPDEFV